MGFIISVIIGWVMGIVVYYKVLKPVGEWIMSKTKKEPSGSGETIKVDLETVKTALQRELENTKWYQLGKKAQLKRILQNLSYFESTLSIIGFEGKDVVFEIRADSDFAKVLKREGLI